jgi:hypothetical protein
MFYNIRHRSCHRRPRPYMLWPREPAWQPRPQQPGRLHPATLFNTRRLHKTARRSSFRERSPPPLAERTSSQSAAVTRRRLRPGPWRCCPARPKNLPGNGKSGCLKTGRPPGSAATRRRNISSAWRIGWQCWRTRTRR